MRHFVLAMIVLMACHETKSLEVVEPFLVTPQTILPQSFLASTLVEGVQSIPSLQIPTELLDLHIVTRPQAEVRAGPGIEFYLLPTILEKDTLVLRTASSGIWTKIVAPHTSVQGWVHNQALSPINRKSAFITIKPENLNRVFVAKKPTTAFTYLENKKILLDLPKDVPFYTLKENRDKILVIVFPSRSVVWLSKKDVL